MQYSIMTRMKHIEEMQILYLCFSIIICSTQLSQNIIVNSNFTQPLISQYSSFQRYHLSIPGWNCKNTCEIIHCENLIKSRIKSNKIVSLCSGKVIDLISNTVNIIASQTIMLKVGIYKISFVYYLPYQTANLKILQVRFNQVLLLHVHPLAKGAAQGIYFSANVTAVEGENLLSFQNKGYSADSIGFKIGNVGVFRILDSFATNLLTNFFQFEFLSKANSLPGGRVFFGSLLGFMINLDRYQLYAYHRRNYSYHAHHLLQAIGQLQNKKGMLLSQKIAITFPSFTGTLKSAFEQVNLKKVYFNYCYMEDDDLSSFFRDFLTFSCPVIIVLFLIMYCLFQLLRQFAISKSIREFAFTATLLLALTEGNLQEITFHCFAELQFLFSRNTFHKIFNCSAVIVLFTVVYICFAFYLWLKPQYNKKAKIIAGTETSTLSALISVSFDRGMLMFFFGVTHQLLLSKPIFQMSILIFLQSLWIFKRVCSHKHYKHRVILLVVLMDSLIRVYFQITTLIYDLIAEKRLTINQKYHKTLFYILMVLVAFEILLNIYYILKKWLQNVFRISSKIQQTPSSVKKQNFQSYPQSNIQADRFTNENHPQIYLDFHNPIIKGVPSVYKKREIKIWLNYSNKMKNTQIRAQKQ